VIAGVRRGVVEIVDDPSWMKVTPFAMPATDPVIYFLGVPKRFEMVNGAP